LFQIYFFILKSSNSISGNRIRTSFEKTYAMSSYLAAWTVLPQDFGYETAQTQKGKQVNIKIESKNIS
jgi:hypothetical protein